MSTIPPITLRAVDRKRLDSLQERTATPAATDDIWYIHTVLAQCFLPYRDPHADRWQRKNGDFSIMLVSGDVEDAEDVSQVLIPDQRGRPNSYRLMKSPITRSCMCSVLEKHSVRRTRRLIRVRRLMCLLSIFCVCSLPT